MPSSGYKKSRDYDRESGKNRTKSGKKQRAPPPPESSSESELPASESEVEVEYKIKQKDVHRQKPESARSRKTTAQTSKQEEEVGEEPESAKTPAPSQNFLVALAYRQGTSVVQYEARSFYIPDCMSLMSAAFFICELLVPNSLVHELDAAFVSLSFYLYVGHLFFYHVLRIRDSVGELTREERRCLRHYENVGPAEAWPVPTPLIAILESYGVVSPPSRYYGKIVPKLPAYTELRANRSLLDIGGIAGGLRCPMIPAMQEFLYRFGTGTATFDGDILYPVADPALTAGAAGPPAVPPNTFLGLNNSTATGDAQYLFFNHGWNTPSEVADTSAPASLDMKRSLVHRMNVPHIGETATLTGIEAFLGFRDGESKAWMRRLLSSATTVTRFFPGSTNLSAIGTTGIEEIITPITWNTTTQRVGEDDTWYRGRSNWKYSFNGFVNAENSGTMYRVAAAAAPNSRYATHIHPTALQAATYASNASGPYFVSPAGSVSVPLSLVEAHSQPDPVVNMRAMIDDTLYDNLAGRSRS